MWIHAEEVSVECEETGFTLEVFGYANTPDADEVRLTIDLKDIDLDAFYDRVKAYIGSHLQERDEARRTAPVPSEALSIGREQWSTAWEIDQSMRDAYDQRDPKHPDFHSVHADIWDNREKV